jgi:hypothetical protein
MATVLIHVVADYGPGDLAFAEVAQRLALHLGAPTVVATPVPPFDTLSAGFCIGQLALTDGPAGRVVFHNVAPRADEDDPRPENEGEELVAAWTDAGTLVLGPHAGHVLSFLGGRLARAQVVELPGSGSQFRSRDFFPALAAELAAGDERSLGRPLDPWAILPVPAETVVYVDGYGNLKTSWSDPPAPSGTKVAVTIGDRSHTATVSDGTFEVADRELSFAPGSSGWPLPSGGERRFYELLLRGGSAAELFGGPGAGARVRLG